ncbi:coiled-coil domain-containing protein [Tepidibacter formicigenes]|jgi:archaellum component FlaC|uniref:Uncharacterized protein n=1 Tax=Tepidibacter formicigenes DSM 15518 TaxID=1123349 RepID=A0A1M6NTI6_9FIRM|nr:hypothetical protein [Tepidibacter formicigenes]SHJ99036.1 hypothetical protein SAMN02744037_01367 [Tepidibacter formicigenes DSM 15518]
MEEKIFEMLREMKSDINEMKSDINGMKKDINGMKSDINEVKENQKMMRKTLDSVYEQVADLTIFKEETKIKLEEISNEIESTKVDINSLTMKMAHSDNQIIEIKRNLKKVK